MAVDISNLEIIDSFQNLVQVSSSAEGNVLATALGVDFIVEEANTALNALTADVATTASYAITASFVDGNVESASFAEFARVADLAISASYVLSTETSISSSFSENARTSDSSISSSFAEFASNASNAVSASHAESASIANGLTDGINVSLNSGSFNDLVATTLSVTNFNAVTSSVVITGDAFIQLNNDTPAQRYAGIKVVDSGSVNTTASFEFDGSTNDWFYEYEDGGGLDFGVAMFGPEYNTKGSPIYNTANTLVKADGSHHLLDSIITDDGTLVSVGGNLTANVITANTNFAGNLVGNASTATTASHALTAVSADTAVSASHSEYASIAGIATLLSATATASYADLAGNARDAVSASFAENARTADSATIAVSASFAEDARTADTADSATSASFASTVSRTLVQNLTIDGAANGTVDTLAIASNTASIDLTNGNFFQITLQNGVDTHLVASNIQAGQNVNLKITNNATAAGTISFDTNDFKFADGTAFTVTAATSAVDLMSFVTFDTSNLIGTGIKAIS